jgi:dephospho-CoA kinase
MIAGLTGGICSGKSTVSNTLRKNNIPVIDADQIARDVVVKDSPGLSLLIERFGNQYLLNDNLDRQALGQLICQDQEALKDLNIIMKPLMEIEFQKQVDYFKDYPIIVYDAALIVENGNADKYRPLIVVACQAEQQIERLMKRGTGHGAITREQALGLINIQMPVLEKKKYADFHIDTSKNVEYSISQTENVILCLKIMVRDEKLANRFK